MRCKQEGVLRPEMWGTLEGSKGISARSVFWIKPDETCFPYVMQE